MAKKKTEEDQETGPLEVQWHQARLAGAADLNCVVVIIDPHMPQVDGLGHRTVRWLPESEAPFYAEVLTKYLAQDLDPEFAIQLTEVEVNEGTAWQIIECPVCKGEGQIKSGSSASRCYRCSGRGKIAT